MDLHEEHFQNSFRKPVHDRLELQVEIKLNKHLKQLEIPQKQNNTRTILLTLEILIM